MSLAEDYDLMPPQADQQAPPQPQPRLATLSQILQGQTAQPQQPPAPRMAKLSDILSGQASQPQQPEVASLPNARYGDNNQLAQPLPNARYGDYEAPALMANSQSPQTDAPQTPPPIDRSSDPYWSQFWSKPLQPNPFEGVKSADAFTPPGPTPEQQAESQQMTQAAWGQQRQAEKQMQDWFARRQDLIDNSLDARAADRAAALNVSDPFPSEAIQVLDPVSQKNYRKQYQEQIADPMMQAAQAKKAAMNVGPSLGAKFERAMASGYEMGVKGVRDVAKDVFQVGGATANYLDSAAENAQRRADVMRKDASFIEEQLPQTQGGKLITGGVDVAGKMGAAALATAITRNPKVGQLMLSGLFAGDAATSAWDQAKQQGRNDNEAFQDATFSGIKAALVARLPMHWSSLAKETAATQMAGAYLSGTAITTGDAAADEAWKAIVRGEKVDDEAVKRVGMAMLQGGLPAAALHGAGMISRSSTPDMRAAETPFTAKDQAARGGNVPAVATDAYAPGQQQALPAVEPKVAGVMAGDQQFNRTWTGGPSPDLTAQASNESGNNFGNKKEANAGQQEVLPPENQPQPLPDNRPNDSVAVTRAQPQQRNEAMIFKDGQQLRATVSTREGENGGYEVSAIKLHKPDGSYEIVNVPPGEFQGAASSADAREQIFQHLESQYPLPRQIEQQPPPALSGKAAEAQAVTVRRAPPIDEMKKQSFDEGMGRMMLHALNEETIASIAHDMEDRGVNGQDTLDTFWKDTYPNLPPEAQAKIHNNIARSIGFKPGDVISTDRAGNETRLKDWEDVSRQVLDGGGDLSMMEKRERGMLAFMESLNQAGKQFFAPNLGTDANQIESHPSPAQPVAESAAGAQGKVERHTREEVRAAGVPDEIINKLEAKNAATEGPINEGHRQELPRNAEGGAPQRSELGGGVQAGGEVPSEVQSGRPVQGEIGLRNASTTGVVKSQPELSPKKVDPVANRFRALADAQQKTIDEKRRPMTQNPTPKRRAEEASRRIDANNLERAQQAMRAIADARDAGTLPKILEGIKSKSQVEPLVRKGLTGGGYYDRFESRDYSNTSAEGKALQKLLDESIDPRARDAKEKADKLKQLEQSVDFKPIPGFFPTPKPLVERMIEAADIQKGDKVLEPSAGRGDIADEVAKITGKENVHTAEINYDLRKILEAKGYKVGGDFIGEPPEGQFDKVVMNPPFEKGQDQEHVRAAYYTLKPGGKLVAIMSEGSFSRSGKKDIDFQEWLKGVGGLSEKIPSGAFQGKDSSRQTGVATRMVEIRKPDAPGKQGFDVDQSMLGGILQHSDTKAVYRAGDEKAADQASKGLVGTAAQSLKATSHYLIDEARRFKGSMFPTITRLGEKSGDLAAELVASKTFAKEAGKAAAMEIVGTKEGKPFLPKRIDAELDKLAGAFLVQDNLDSIQRNFLDQADKAEDPKEQAKYHELAANVGSMIGAEGSPFDTRTDFAKAGMNPEVQKVIARYKEWFEGMPEENFRVSHGVAESEELPTRGHMSGARVNLKAILPDDPRTASTIRTTMKGNLTNPRLTDSPFARMAKGSAPAYDISLSAMIENTLGKGTEIANQHRLFEQMVKDGMAKIGPAGKVVMIGGKPAKAFEVEPARRFVVKNVGTNFEQTTAFTKPTQKLYVRADAVQELRRGLAVDEPARIPVVTKVAEVANTTALASLSEAAYHISNQITALVSSPGTGTILPGMIKNLARLWQGGPEVAKQLASIAKIGALKEGPPPASSTLGKLNPLRWTSAIIHATDRAGRLLMDDAFTKMADKGIVKDTPQNRRDFINQFGQYNSRAQQKQIAFARETGLGPFATAGTNFLMMGIKKMALSPGATATTIPNAIRLRLAVLGRFAVPLAAVATSNYLRWGRMDGSANLPVGALRLDDDKDGKMRYFDVLGNLGVTRGLRATGALATIEGMRRGESGAEIKDKAWHDVWTSGLAPFAGPLPNTVAKAATGYDMHGSQVAQTAEKGQSQAFENIKAAAKGLNPIVDAATGGKNNQLGRFAIKTTSRADETQAEMLASRLAQDRLGGLHLPPSTKVKHDAREAAVQQLRAAGTPQEKTKIVGDAIKAGTIDPSEGRGLIEESMRSHLANRIFKAPIEDALAVWDRATPKEREDIRVLMMKKIAASREMKPEEKRAAFAKVKGDTKEPMTAQ